MLTPAMTAPRTRKPAATKPAPSTSRAKSGLTEIGDAAMRKALLRSLKRHRWALPAVAEEFRLTGSANVLRAIRSLGLVAEYDAARARGDLRPGPRTA